MAELAKLLFPEGAEEEATAKTPHKTGILPSQEIRKLIRNREIVAGRQISEEQIQPASIDLRLGAVAHRVRASFLPGAKSKVSDKIAALGMHEVDISNGAVLEKGCVYIVSLMESLKLRKRISANANPKSSTGRLDVFTRLITDQAVSFDLVKEAYKGPLYAEISPRAFSIVVREGMRLNQLRLRRGNPAASEKALRQLYEKACLVDVDLKQEDISDGLPIRVDLRGSGSDIVGYKARVHTGLIDLDKVGHYDPMEFWEPVRAARTGDIILNPGDFYILASREAVTVPPDHAAEMVAYDTLVGEFRVHYAGFFDPGFGHSETGDAASRAVLEVRSHEVPFTIEDGQVVGRLLYERLTAVPDKIYGAGIGSSYQRQGLALAKQFKRP
jgi:dCTP deaminase